MPGNIAITLEFILKALSDIVIMILLLRLILPFLRADFRNPIAQGLLRITSPIIVPVRRLVPSVGKLDTATLLVALGIQVAANFVIFRLLFGMPFSWLWLLLMSIIMLATLTIYLFVYAIIIRVVLSWIAPGQHSAISAIADTLAEPVLRPFRRLLPAMGGFDLSPLIATIALIALTKLIGGLPPF